MVEMNTLNKYYTYSYANEVTEPTPPLRLCLAIYLETDRNNFLRHDHTTRKTVTSLGPLVSRESGGLFF